MNFLKTISGVVFLGIIGNIFLLILKMVVGFLFKSQAMIADGVNSIMDVFASFMTLIGGKVSEKPRDENHHFGHKKAEFLFSLFVSVSMMVGAFMIFLSSFQGLLSNHVVHFSSLLIFVCIVTILVKTTLFFYSRKLFVQTGSLLVESSMLDHRNDILITSFTLLSVFFSFFEWYILDSFVGMGIAVWIFWSGMKIFFESYHILMDQALSIEVENDIKKYIKKRKNILGITKFETTSAGYQYILILSILVNGNLTTFESHKIADI